MVRIAKKTNENLTTFATNEAPPFDVLHEDEHILVIDKPSGLVVHPAEGHPDSTLLDRLNRQDGQHSIVHRLDKETSGCLVVAKHDRAHAVLTDQFEHRRIRKLYLAAVDGVPMQPWGHIENRIGSHPFDRKRMAVLFDGTGKTAVTDWEIQREHLGSALILCTLRTGRTHQIRVHLRDVLQCPILGDTLYGYPPAQRIPVDRLLLHAWKLAFDHPLTQRRMEFEAAIPVEFSPWLAVEG